VTVRVHDAGGVDGCPRTARSHRDVVGVSRHAGDDGMTLTAMVSPLTAPLPTVAPVRPLDIALLGLGRVGSAVASLALNAPEAIGMSVRIAGALVRNCDRVRDDGLHRRVRLTSDAADLLARRPDLVIEVLGGIEPARTIVLQALERGIPVVTANKSLMAAHGDELIAAAARGGVALRYEACVLAGVPFLGTFASRPLAARISRVSGIVNGTTNFILTRMEREHQDFEDALADAQRRGFAEPNPASDVDGVDAVEKLSVLIRHFGHRTVRPAAIEMRGIRAVQSADLRHAREFGGAIKMVVDAEWSADGVKAFVGPAFVPAEHKLSRIDGVENAVCLHGRAGVGSSDPALDLFYAGPGAGPTVTAATILDDVTECRARPVDVTSAARAESRAPVRCDPPTTAWFVRISGVSLPHGPAIADFLSSYGVSLRRITANDTSMGGAACYLLTWPSPRARLERALTALADAAPCDTFCIRTLES
jgi:homoserine dehydrogenase